MQVFVAFVAPPAFTINNVASDALKEKGLSMDEKNIKRRVNLKICHKLKELRKANGYSQEFVASKLGVSRQAYSYYERGERRLDFLEFKKLTDLYHISIDDFLKEVNAVDEYADERSWDEKTLPSINDYVSFLERNKSNLKPFSELEKELLYYFGKLSGKDKRELIEIAKIKINP